MTEQNLPEDFQRCIAFHGHLCGGLTVGYRIVRAAAEELGIGRAEDEEGVAVAENDTCAVDAVQTLLGCTFGKGNLRFLDYGKMAFTFWDRRTGRGIRVVRRPGTRGKSTEEMLAMKTGDLLDIQPAQGPIPEEARIRESETCAKCGEETMVTRLEDGMCPACRAAG